MTNVDLRLCGRGPRAFALGLFALLLSSCQPYAQTSGDMTVAVGASEFILLDAPAQSCRAQLEGSTTSDVSALHMNLGKMKITWDGEAGTQLKVIYVKINVVSGGVSNAERPITIASQDLNCAMNFQLTERKLTPAEASFTFTQEILVGGLKSADTTLRSSFSGTVNVIVYALKQREGAQDVPVVGRTSARFTFQGIF